MNQLTLFATLEPPRRDRREELFELAMSDKFYQELLTLAAQRPTEWIEPHDFWTVANKRGLGSYFGHALHTLARAGKLQAKNVYFGSEHPGDGNYRGFKTVFMFAGGNQP